VGRKVNPKSFRTGINKLWDSSWFCGNKKGYIKNLHEDIEIRKYLYEKIPRGSIAKIRISRTQKETHIEIHTSKSGIIIGRGGELIEKLGKELHKKFDAKFLIDVKDVKGHSADANLIAEDIALQIEKRLPYRMVIKRTIRRAKESGILGIKIYVGGRLNGVDIARGEFFKEGNIPLQTIRADISYAKARANTTYGVIGIKVWVYHGEIFDKNKEKNKFIVSTTS